MKTTVTVINLDSINPSYKVEKYCEVSGIEDTFTANVVKLNGVEIKTGQSFSVEMEDWAIQIEQDNETVLNIKTIQPDRPTRNAEIAKSARDQTA